MVKKSIHAWILDRPSGRNRFVRLRQHGRSTKEFVFRWWSYPCRLVWLHTGILLKWTRQSQGDRQLYPGKEVWVISAFHRPTSDQTGLQEQGVPDGNAACQPACLAFPLHFFFSIGNTRYRSLLCAGTVEEVKDVKWTPCWDILFRIIKGNFCYLSILLSITVWCPLT